MNIGVRDLELLEAMEEHGTLTAAALGLHISQPALSQRLKGLEQRLGARLFERRGRQLVITASGERMYVAARTALGELRAAQLDVRLIAEGRHRPIRLVSQCATNYAWLPAVLREFRSRGPAVEVQISTVGDRDTISTLLDGRIDIALITKLDREMDQIHLQPLFDDELVAVVSTSHPWATRTQVTRRDIEQEHLVLFDSYDQSRVPSVPLPIPAGVKPGRLTTVATDADLLIEMVRTGDCATVLPSWVAEPYLKMPHLVAVSIGPKPQFRTWFCATRHGEASTSVNAFAQLLVEQLAKVGPGRLKEHHGLAV
jgi:LysR family transcriptional regulator for metE and metH